MPDGERAEHGGAGNIQVARDGQRENSGQVSRGSPCKGLRRAQREHLPQTAGRFSVRHARITRRGAQYFIEDLGSTNGTFINRGRRLLPGDRQPLNDGDEIIIGKTFLKFKVIN